MEQFEGFHDTEVIFASGLTLYTATQLVYVDLRAH